MITSIQKYASILLLALSLTNCTQQKQDFVQKTEQEVIHENLDCMGFTSEGFDMLGGDHIVVDGDLLLEKKLVLEGFDENYGNGDEMEERQYSVTTAGVLNWANVGAIPFWIDPTVGAAWTTAIRTATANWSNIPGCAVVFVESATAAPPAGAVLIFTISNTVNPAVTARIPAACRAVPANLWAWALFPAGNAIGGGVIINANLTPGDDNGRATIMRHEIGHTLGFRHSDALNNGEPATGTICNGTFVSAPTLVCNTPANDATSVMLSFFGGAGTVGFNVSDQRAAQVLYPITTGNASIGFTSYNRNSGRLTMTLGCPTGWANITVRRGTSIKYNSCGVIPLGGVTFLDQDNGFSPYTYNITYTNFRGDATATSTAVVYWF